MSKIYLITVYSLVAFQLTACSFSKDKPKKNETQQTHNTETVVIEVKEAERKKLTDSLFVAIENTDTVSLKQILSLDIVDLNSENEQGLTPLMLAIELDYSMAVKLMLEKGALVFYQSKVTQKNALDVANHFESNLKSLLIRAEESQYLKIIEALKSNQSLEAFKQLNQRLIPVDYVFSKDSDFISEVVAQIESGDLSEGAIEVLTQVMGEKEIKSKRLLKYNNRLTKVAATKKNTAILNIVQSEILENRESLDTLLQSIDSSSVEWNLLMVELLSQRKVGLTQAIVLEKLKMIFEKFSSDQKQKSSLLSLADSNQLFNDAKATESFVFQVVDQLKNNKFNLAYLIATLESQSLFPSTQIQRKDLIRVLVTNLYDKNNHDVTVSAELLRKVFVLVQSKLPGQNANEELILEVLNTDQKLAQKHMILALLLEFNTELSPDFIQKRVLSTSIADLKLLLSYIPKGQLKGQKYTFANILQRDSLDKNEVVQIIDLLKSHNLELFDVKSLSIIEEKLNIRWERNIDLSSVFLNLILPEFATWSKKNQMKIPIQNWLVKEFWYQENLGKDYLMLRRLKDLFDGEKIQISISSAVQVNQAVEVSYAFEIFKSSHIRKDINDRFLELKSQIKSVSDFADIDSTFAVRTKDYRLNFTEYLLISNFLGQYVNHDKLMRKSGYSISSISTACKDAPHKCSSQIQNPSSGVSLEDIRKHLARNAAIQGAKLMPAAIIEFLTANPVLLEKQGLFSITNSVLSWRNDGYLNPSEVLILLKVALSVDDPNLFKEVETVLEKYGQIDWSGSLNDSAGVRVNQQKQIHIKDITNLVSKYLAPHLLEQELLIDVNKYSSQFNQFIVPEYCSNKSVLEKYQRPGFDLEKNEIKKACEGNSLKVRETELDLIFGDISQWNLDLSKLDPNQYGLPKKPTNPVGL